MILRRKTAKNFTIVNNYYLEDKKLSWKAKGLISYLMMLPDTWIITVEDLKNRSKDRRDGTATGMKELIKNNYCKRLMLRDKKGQLAGYDYIVSDSPITDNPDTDNAELLKTNNSSTIKNNNKTNNESSINGSLFPELEDTVTTFSESLIFDEKVFKVKFKNELIAGINIDYYYTTVDDWCERLPKQDKRRLKTSRGWLGEIRQFMRNDKSSNKLVMLDNAKSNNDLVDYLNI